ncbi:MAG: alcohol dehydrogenase catalytic domain-containing protein [bacterium]|nr:alcohol dehydrogenase catalytic domain-containing protein [bacterium]
MSSTPKVSIIIRAFNEEKHLGNLLDAIAIQSDQNFETILVDSGSTDHTLEIARARCSKVIEIASRDFTFGYSLNKGCAVAQGEFLVVISAHAYPTNAQWLSSLIAPFANKKVAMVYGRHIGAQTTKFSERRDFETYFGSEERKKHPLYYFANNANSAVRAVLWKVFPFDEYLTGLEDIAWARKAIAKGCKVFYTPQAAAYHIHSETWPQVYNRYRREAIAARRIGIPRPPFATPSATFFLRRTLGDIAIQMRHFSFKGLREIFQFRYNQWKGTRQGWYRDHDIDIERERGALFFSGANMRVVVTEKSNARLEESQVPEIKPGDVLIKVAFTGVCATDVEVYEGTLGYYKEGRAQYPITPGHEFSGTVARIGANVKNFNIGEKVIGECVLSCRECAHCDSGSYAACKDRKEVGVMNYHGSYAQFIVLPAMYVHKVPEGLDLKTASLAEPLAVVLRGIRRLGPRLKPESNCAVVGAGPIGNLAAQVLAKYGHHVTVFNRREARLKHLTEIAQTRNTLEGLEQFDVIIEASGNHEALKTVLEQSRTDVTILLLGFPYALMDYNFEQVVGQEKVIVGSVGGAREDFDAALAILPTLITAPFMQATFPLDQFEKAWDTHRAGEQLKVMIENDATGSVVATVEHI